jgi:pimeloyl-ACP methyl ester carboxylesterase
MSDLIARLGVRLDTMGAAARMRRFREGWPASASPGVAFHTTAKVQFRYRTAGAGDTIVFTADPPMTLENYGALIDVFAHHFRVIVVELPAMGFSAAAENFAFGFRETNDELAQFLRAVAGERAIFAFSCAAGLAGIDIAVRHPELCSHLALLQTGDVAAFALWKAGRDPKGILARPFVGQMVMKRLAPRRMPDWYALSVGKQEMMPQLCQCATTSFEHGALWSLASAYQRYLDERIVLSPPMQPLLSIWGEADRSHPPENRHSIRRLVPEAACVSLEDLGHTPELEEPARVLEIVRAFREGG